MAKSAEQKQLGGDRLVSKKIHSAHEKKSDVA